MVPSDSEDESLHPGYGRLKLAAQKKQLALQRAVILRETCSEFRLFPDGTTAEA